MRLAKMIAESGVASRRKAEQLIEQGRVFVDGKCITSPVCFVDESNEIVVDGRKISKSSRVVVWKFYKPRGVITSRFDPQGRTTVFDILEQHKIKDRLIYIGRLDYNSEGLLLFTNNGDFARKMELPSSNISRTYRVRILGDLSEEQICKLQHGITIDGVHYKPMQITFEKNDSRSANKWLKITLSEGKNREIRKVMEHFHCEVNRLIRIQYGDISLGDLKPGEFEEVKIAPNKNV